MKSPFCCLLLFAFLTAALSARGTAGGDTRDEQSLCAAAQRAGQWSAALVHAQSLLLTVSDAASAGEAISLAVRLAVRAQQVDTLRAELTSRRASLSPPRACLLARLLEIAGDIAAATAILEESALRDPPLGLTQLVEVHLNAKQEVSAAAAQLRLVQSPGGKTPAKVLRLIELLHWSAQTDAAGRWMEEWKRLAPDSTAPWLLAARLYTNEGRDADASQELERALLRWQNDPELLARYAVSLRQEDTLEATQKAFLRLFDTAKSLRGKLLWLPQFMDYTSSEMLLIKELERRHAANPKSPGPLLGLAEWSSHCHEQDRCLRLCRKALDLVPHDTAVLARTAAAALAAGKTALAESLLARAERLDKTPALRQQHALVLLELNRRREAGALLAKLAAVLPEEELAELAFMLTCAGHGLAAAGMLADGVKRFPDNYRLAWLRVEILLRDNETGGLAEECLRLATTPFPSLPVNLIEPSGRWLTNSPVPLLERFAEPAVAAGADDDTMTIQSMISVEYGWGCDASGQSQIIYPRMPAHPAQLRGIAARWVLLLAYKEGPEALAAAQAKLLAAGVHGAVLAERIASGLWSRDPEWRFVRDACEQYPEQRPLLLRFVLGEMPWTPDTLPLAGGTAWPVENASTEQLLERSPAAALAWSVFRESDPGYAVFAALKLASAPVAAERRIAQEALELLEKNPDPALLRGAVPHLGASVFLDEFPAESLLPRLRSHLEEWADAAPPGRLRERLQDYLLLHTWKGSDPAAHLRRVAEKLARGGDSMPEYTGIARWPELPRPLPPKTPASSTEDPRSRMYDRRPAGLSLPAGTALLHVPPAFPGVYHKTWDFKQGSRLVQAVSLLSPGKWSTDTARLRAALESCRDTDVKAVAALATGDVPFITACVDAVAAGSPPDADGLALAAAWAWRQRQPDKAVILLEKLSSLQPPLQIRTADATIVSAGQLLLAASEPVSDTVRNACGAALDRLAVFPIKATDMESLAQLADQLGMKERLLRLREAVATAKKRPTLRAAPALPFPSSTPPHPLAGFLTAPDARPGAEPAPVDFNQTAPWIQGFLTLVRDQAGDYVLPMVEPGNLTDLRKHASFHAKVIAGLESLAAAPGSARARWFAGLALIECGAAGKAAVVLKRLVSEALPARPLLARAACRLAFNGQLEAALEIAASLSPVTRAELFAHAIIADGGPALDQLEPALDLAERWLAALRTLQPGDVISRHYDEYGDSDTVSQALEALEAARFADEATLRSFFSNSEVLLSSASTDPLAARRRALLPALYRALALPPLADSTVLMRLSSAEKAGIPWPTKAEDAMQLLLSESDRPLSAAYNLSTWTPEMFLLQEAVRRPAWLADTALPALEKGGRVRKAAGLRQLLPLLDCPAVEFPAALEHMFAAQPSAAKYDLRIAGLLVARFRELPDASAMERLPDIPASSADPAREPPRDIWNSPTNPATASE